MNMHTVLFRAQIQFLFNFSWSPQFNITSSGKNVNLEMAIKYVSFKFANFLETDMDTITKNKTWPLRSSASITKVSIKKELLSMIMFNIFMTADL